MGRISQLKIQANKALSMIKTGSYQKRQYRKKAINRFVESLYAAGNVPANWYALTSNHIISIVNYWKKNTLSDDSIRMYLAEIRYFLQAINHNLEGIDNQSLGLTRAKEEPKNPFANDCLEKISDSLVCLLLRLQTEFGLTLSEAFRFTPDLHARGDHLLLSREMTNNSKDRIIPVFNKNQRHLLAMASSLIEMNKNPIKQYGYSGVRERYRFQIKNAGLTPSVNYRYIYASMRMEHLNLHRETSTAKGIIANEMGISLLTLRRYLNEQNKAKKC